MFSRLLTMLLQLTVSVFTLTGCSVTIGDGDDNQERYYFGFVKISSPKVNDSVLAYKHSGLGLSIGQDIILGWDQGKHVLVPLTQNRFDGEFSDAPCQIVIFVDSKEEAIFTNEVLSQFDEGIVCKATL